MTSESPSFLERAGKGSQRIIASIVRHLMQDANQLKTCLNLLHVSKGVRKYTAETLLTRFIKTKLKSKKAVKGLANIAGGDYVKV